MRQYLMNKSKGQIAKVLGGLIVGVVMLFVGLFMISAVSGVFSDASLYSCTYATTTNSTNSSGANSTIIINRTFTATTFSQHCAVSGGAYLSVTFFNDTADVGTLTVTLNANFLRNITIPAVSSTTTITGITVVPSTVNNVSYYTDTAGLVNITSDTMVTSSTEAHTSTGTIHANTVTLTGTVFSVLGLVIIIVALAMAIGSLKGVVQE